MKINDESWLDTKNFLQCNVMVPYYFPKNLLEIADINFKNLIIDSIK